MTRRPWARSSSTSVLRQPREPPAVQRHRSEDGGQMGREDGLHRHGLQPGADDCAHPGCDPGPDSSVYCGSTGTAPSTPARTRSVTGLALARRAPTPRVSRSSPIRAERCGSESSAPPCLRGARDSARTGPCSAASAPRSAEARPEISCTGPSVVCDSRLRSQRGRKVKESACVDAIRMRVRTRLRRPS